MKKYDKCYMIDTSVIINNPEQNLSKLSQGNKNALVITDIVLQELDRHKTSLKNDVSWASRVFADMIKNSDFSLEKKLNEKEALGNDFIYKAILTTKSEEIDLFIIFRRNYKEETLKSSSVDDAKIIEVAYDYKCDCVTNDTYFKVLAKSIGVKNVSFLKWNSLSDPDSIKSSFTVNDKDLDVSSFKKWDQVTVAETKMYGLNVLDNGNYSYYISNGQDLLKQDMNDQDFSKKLVKPQGIEQKFYTRLLESNFKVMLVSGSTGSGKTLLALQEGLSRVKDPNSPIDGIVYMRYTINVEDKFSALGYRKGDESTKLGYFNYPLYGALKFIADKGRKRKSDDEEFDLDKLIKENNIEFLDIAHARGITRDNKFIIFDEIQNAPDPIIKLIGTRIGENSCIVFMGDHKQVDHPYLTKERNGLITLLKLSEKDSMITNVKLTKTIRSELAEWFEENIN